MEKKKFQGVSTTTITTTITMECRRRKVAFFLKKKGVLFDSDSFANHLHCFGKLDSVILLGHFGFLVIVIRPVCPKQPRGAQSRVMRCCSYYFSAEGGLVSVIFYLHTFEAYEYPRCSRTCMYVYKSYGTLRVQGLSQAVVVSFDAFLYDKQRIQSYGPANNHQQPTKIDGRTSTAYAQQIQCNVRVVYSYRTHFSPHTAEGATMSHLP